MSFTAPTTRPLTNEALVIDTSTETGRQLVLNILGGMAKGYRPAPSLERQTELAVKWCGAEFGDFMAQRYGGRIAKAVAQAQAKAVA